MKNKIVAVLVMLAACVAANAYGTTKYIEFNTFMSQSEFNPKMGFGIVFDRNDRVIPCLSQTFGTIKLNSNIRMFPSSIEFSALLGYASQDVNVGYAVFGVWEIGNFDAMVGLSYMSSFEETSMEEFFKDLGIIIGGRFRN